MGRIRRARDAVAELSRCHNRVASVMSSKGRLAEDEAVAIVRRIGQMSHGLELAFGGKATPVDGALVAVAQSISMAASGDEVGYQLAARRVMAACKQAGELLKRKKMNR